MFKIKQTTHRALYHLKAVAIKVQLCANEDVINKRFDQREYSLWFDVIEVRVILYIHAGYTSDSPNCRQSAS